MEIVCHMEAYTTWWTLDPFKTQATTQCDKTATLHQDNKYIPKLESSKAYVA